MWAHDDGFQHRLSPREKKGSKSVEQWISKCLCRHYFSLMLLFLLILPAFASRPDDRLWSLVETFSASSGSVSDRCALSKSLLRGNWYANMDGPGTGIIINASNIVSVCEAGNVPGQTSTRAMRLGGGFFNQQRGGISIALMQG